MNITQWMESHKRSILFLLLVFVAGGVVSGFRLPVALFPNVHFPRVQVSLDAGDRPAERMAVEVTWPVEEAVRSVPGVRNVRSSTSRGSADISIDFDWGQDMVSAKLQIESAINQVLASLPSGTTFDVRRMDPTVFPVIAYSLTSDTVSQVKLRDIAKYQLRPLLSTVRGVASVGVQGGEKEEYRVTVDPVRLKSFNLSMSDIANALSTSNVINAVGKIEDHFKLFLVVSDTSFKNISQINNTVVRSGKDGVVLLDDVANVSSEVAPQWIRVTANGKDAVLFQVYQQPGGNTVQISRDVKSKLLYFRSKLPKDIKISNWYDQSELILSSAGSVRDAIIIGIILATIILFIFLGNYKVTLIAVITVPAVLAATVLILFIFHMSFNIMTLGGMAAAVGLIIDDTIVMLEHIIRRFRSGDMPDTHHRKVLAAVREFAKPLTGSSASTIIIFLPLAFLSGVTGAFFKALSLTMAASLFISYILAFLAVPILADRFLDEKDSEKEDKDLFGHQIADGYTKIMNKIIKRPFLLLIIVAPVILIGWFGYKHTGSGFMPQMDEGGFILDYRTPSGTSLNETDRLLGKVEKILINTPDVQTYSRRTGLQLGGGLTEANEGDYFVKLKPFPRRPIEEVMNDVRSRIQDNIPGLEIEMAQLMEDLIGDLTAVPQPIEIKIYSDNGKLLKKLGPKVADAIRNIKGVVDVRDGIVLAGDAINININRVKASLEGVDPGTVTQLLTDYLTGKITTQIDRDPKLIDVRLWIPSDLRSIQPDIGKLQIRAPDGHLFPLKRIADISVETGQPQIDRDNLKRMIAVTGRISGRDIGSTIRDVKNKLGSKGIMPDSVYYEFGGLYSQQKKAFKGLIIVFVSAVMLIFLLLLYLYESIRAALAILSMPLLAVSAVFTGLWLTDTELNITSMMGMTMIVGIVTEVTIFYVSEFYDTPKNINRIDALIIAGRNRMRPIAMTTLAAILALLPLALAIGQGASMQQPLAIAIISGLLVQMPLVLIVLPVLFFLLNVERK